MTQYGTRTYLICMRETFNGLPMRPGVEVAQGETIKLRAMWTNGDGDKYPGELALVPVDPEGILLFRQAGMVWIASGDVQEVTE